MEITPKKVTNLINSNNFKFKKNFGQNFIIDSNTVNNIVNKSQVDKDTLVIEIGPGAGSLTTFLAQKAGNVLCYEIDVKLKEILNQQLREYSNVEVIYSDFLDVDVSDDIKKYDYKKIYVVANLPYYITTPIIIKIIEEVKEVDKIVVMVQKEVGNRFKAVPGTKEYNSLTVFINYYFDVKKLLDISRNVFIPKPNVDSIVVEFVRKRQINNLIDEKLFFKLIRDSFKQKRKTIKNNLKEYDLNIIESVLKNHNLDLSVRAEKLTLDIFIELADSLSK